MVLNSGFGNAASCDVALSTYSYGGIKKGFAEYCKHSRPRARRAGKAKEHKPQITQSPFKRVGALDVLVPQERWHGLRLPEVVLLLDV